MFKYASIALLALACLTAPSVNGQTRRAVKINEVMVENSSSIVDDFGEHHGWIELFNGNFAPVEISTMYLGLDTVKRNWYPIPLGDVNTRIAKRQHVVFFADGQPNKGTFHTNFILKPDRENTVYLFDTNGDIIDQVTVPASLQMNQTYARLADGTGEWGVRTGSDDSYITPSSANVIRDSNNKIALFAEQDANGFAMTLMAMGIVFSALFILCLSFYGISKIGAAVAVMNKRRAHGIETGTIDIETDHDSGEEIAAIVLAIHEHFNAHDKESSVLTINKVKRAYSPWSSKIYGLRVVPEKKIK